MSTLAAVVLFIGILGYAVFGGADFGAGFWDLVAGGTKRGGRPRAVIDHSIAPVWEANHVWLIFVFVVLWTSFPEAYASITLTLFVPLTIAAFGIVLRGSSFAFRKSVLADTGTPYVRCAVRHLVGDRPVLLRRDRRSHRLRARARRRRGRRPVGQLGQPDLDPRRRPRRVRRVRTSPRSTSSGTPVASPTTRWSSTSGSAPSVRPSSPEWWRSAASSCSPTTPSTSSTG